MWLFSGDCWFTAFQFQPYCSSFSDDRDQLFGTILWMLFCCLLLLVSYSIRFQSVRNYWPVHCLTFVVYFSVLSVIVSRIPNLCDYSPFTFLYTPIYVFYTIIRAEVYKSISVLFSKDDKDLCQVLNLFISVLLSSDHMWFNVLCYILRLLPLCVCLLIRSSIAFGYFLLGCTINLFLLQKILNEDIHYSEMWNEHMTYDKNMIHMQHTINKAHTIFMQCRK